MPRGGSAASSGSSEPAVRPHIDQYSSAPACADVQLTIEEQEQGQPKGLYTTGRTPCGASQNGRCLPALRSGRECKGRSPPTPSRAWRLRAPDEGRCRADPHCTHDGGGRHCYIHTSNLRLSSSSPAASARNVRHVAGVRREVTRQVTKSGPGARYPRWDRRSNLHGTVVLRQAVNQRSS